jgi:hypothetical protein
VRRRPGLVVVAGAGVVLLATSFVPLWATYRIPGLGLVAPETVHQNAWTAYGLTMQLALALIVAATALAGLSVARGRSSEELSRTLLAVTAAATLLLAWQVVRGPRGSSDPGGYGVERGLLLFTGAALAAAMTYGSHRARTETGPAPSVRG